MANRINWDRLRKERQVKRSEANYRPLEIALPKQDIAYWDKAADGLLSRKQMRRLKK